MGRKVNKLGTEGRLGRGVKRKEGRKEERKKGREENIFVDKKEEEKKQIKGKDKEKAFSAGIPFHLPL